MIQIQACQNNVEKMYSDTEPHPWIYMYTNTNTSLFKDEK